VRVLLRVFSLLGQQSTYVLSRSIICDDSNVGVSISRAAQLHALNLLLCSMALKHAAQRRKKHPQHPLV